MPSASNATRKTASSGRSVNLLHGNEIAAGARSMKRMKRGADSSQESSSQEGFENKKRFVGVRQRPSGRWVAEIKDTTQKIRLWLGTFDSAEEGAKAYDSAARALRGANTRTNFVAAIASSCEATVLTKAANLIRLRQAAATASSKACASFNELCCGSKQSNRPDLIQGSNENRDTPIREGSIFACETLPCVKNRGREEDSPLDYSRLSCHDDGSASAPPFSDSNTALFSDSNTAPFLDSNTALPADEGAKLQPSPSPWPSSSPSPSPAQSLSPSPSLSPSSSPSSLERESIPCATNRADEEAASSADDNEAMLMNTENDVNGISTCQDDAESRSFTHEGTELSRSTDEDDQRDRGDVIPWPDYVLMDELDLSCETSTTGVYPAFEFSEEAMDRDLEHYLSDESSDFLLRLQQHSSSCPAQCEIIGVADEILPRTPVSPGSTDSGECSSLADQALWSSMDLVSLCMVS